MEIQLTTGQRAALDQLRAFAQRAQGTPALMTLQGYAGTGKCLADDQLVQTPRGPVPISSLSVGDKVFGANGRPVAVVGVFPQGDRQSYRVTFRDGAFVECDSEHLWAVRTHKQRQLKTQPRVMTLGAIMAEGLRFASGPHKFTIPLCAPVEYPEAKLPIAPYLLGALIGDGTDLGKTPTLCTPDADAEIVRQVSPFLPEGFDIREDRAAACPRYRFVDTTQNGNRLTHGLRELALAGLLSPERFVPAIYLRASVEQRWALLRGLMDTDGSCRSNRTTFSTKSPQLARDIADLVRSLGGTAVIHHQKREGEIEVNVKTFDCPFLLSRKAANWKASTKNPPSRAIVDITKTRVCGHTCIKVDSDDGLFLTNGYIVTHNTTLVGVLLREVADQLRIAVAAPTNKAVGVLRQKVGDVPAEFRSIHSFLGLKMREREDGTMECSPDGLPSLHEYDLVIIDECSMIGDKLFELIVTMQRGARILFVGDPAQLPPVERSTVVPQVSATFSHVQHRAMLSEVVRQARDNPIIALSMKIREAIERGNAMHANEISAALPNGAESHACVAFGGEATIFNWALSALQSGMDARIVAYTNQAVDGYNRALHHALHGPGAPFAIGERVIVNEQTDEAREAPGISADYLRCRRVSMHTSEEGVVRAIARDDHPFYAQVPACKVLIERDGGGTVIGYIPIDRQAFEAEKNRLWQEWRELKAIEAAAGRAVDAAMVQRRKDASTKASAFSRAFLPIRHVYAITAHKSQGSTIDTVVVDLTNLAKIRDPFTYNRSLYVAATRAARYLAMVA